MNTINKETNQLKEDLITIFYNALDCISEGSYVCDIPMEITEKYNIDGSFTYNRFEARESLSNYLKNYSDLMGGIVEYFSENYAMHIGALKNKDPEKFQVCILIELSSKVLNNNKQFSKLNGNIIILEDERQELGNIFKSIIKGLESNKIDLNNLL